MAYCRCGPDSDVYLFASIANGKSVFYAYISNEVDYSPDYALLESPLDALKYLLKLRHVGLKVPDSAINRLEEEIPK